MSNRDTMRRFTWSTIFFIYAVLYLTDAVILRCYRGSLDDNEETTFDKPEVFITSGCIDTNRTTAFFALGFKTDTNSDTTKAILSGLMLSYATELNVVLVDWSNEAYGPNITIIDDTVFYTLRAVPAAIAIGKTFGKALLRLSDYKMDLNNTVLLGFSLGSHLMGYAGRYVKSQGKEMRLIHGMEPANPLFSKPLPIFTPLNKNDAKYVVCSHTDPGYFGTNQSNCLADIWLNYGYYTDGVDLQPGCPSRMTFKGCNHIRVTFVMKEALTHPGTLLASAATNYAAWEAQNGTTTNIVDLGNFLNTTYAVGNYYVSTNSEDPYGKGEEGLKPEN